MLRHLYIFVSALIIFFSFFVVLSFPAKFSLPWSGWSFFLLIASAMAIIKALKITSSIWTAMALMRILRKKVLKMKFKTDNPIPVKTRLKELLGDRLFISFYPLLFLLAMGFTIGSRGIPAFTEAQSQLLAFSTSVLPLTVIFAWLDYRKGSLASAGQVYSWFTNIGAPQPCACYQVFPQQLGHMGAIRSAYQADTCQFSSCQLQQGFS